MNWFYAKDGQQAGPVDDAELARLVQTGAITDATLVWHSDLPNWQAYATVAPGGAGAAAAATPGINLSKETGSAAVEPGKGSGAAGPGETQCSQCGRVLPAEDVVRIEGMEVCAACKPALLQRLREGAPVSNPTLGAPVYAGFWIRFGAAIIDGIILIPLWVVVLLGLFFLTDLHNIDFAHPPQAQEITRMTRGFLPISFAIQFLVACYSALCINHFGGTPGKRICGLRVVHGEASGRVTFLRGLGRYGAKNIPRSLLGLLAGFLAPVLNTPLVVGYSLVDALFIVFNNQRQSLHDMMADTRVVYDRR